MSASAVATAVEFLRARLPEPPRVLVVLGSGLGGAASELERAVTIPFDDIPGFPRRTQALEGHAGALVAGRWAGVPVLAMQGRFHLYEGWEPADVAIPVRTAAELGAEVMLVTNAAGGVRPTLSAGEVMLIADHINLMWRNPLIGTVAEGEIRFPDMSDPYDAELRRIAVATALEAGVPLTQGVYAAVLGPSYETPAEIRMIARLGADAVGMSTVPEVLVARARGMRVVGLSVISNLAAGLSPHPLSHAEVMEAGERVQGVLTAFVSRLLPRIVQPADEGGV